MTHNLLSGRGLNVMAVGVGDLRRRKVHFEEIKEGIPRMSKLSLSSITIFQEEARALVVGHCIEWNGILCSGCCSRLLCCTSPNLPLMS